MRVLLINRFFWPDESSTSMLATDLAEDLVRAGHEVHVACARILYDRPETKVASREVWNGVIIHRLLSTRFGRKSFIGRLSDLVTFHLSLHLLGPFVCKPDVILVMTDPPLSLLPALWIGLLRSAKVVHHVMDVYPDIAVHLGAMQRSAISTRILARVYRWALSRCARVLALGSVMAERLREKGVEDERIVIVPPWADEEKLISIEREQNRFRKELGLRPEEALLLYSGNMGRAHGFDTILEGIVQLHRDLEEGIQFVFIGDGARRDEIENVVRQRNLHRVRLLPYLPRERLGESLSAADIHLISQDPRSIGLVVPSKLAGILAVGRPVIFIGDARAEIAATLDQYHCGVTVREGDHAAFAAAVRRVAFSLETRDQMGRRAKEAFDAEYSRGRVVTRIIRELESIASAK